MSENKETQEDVAVETAEAKTENQQAAEQTSATEQTINTDQLLLEFEQVKEALGKAEEKANENYELALRAKAEAENTKRRMEKDVANAHKFSIEKIVQELLPVIDSLEMGLAALTDENAAIEKFKEGSEMTHKMLLAAVEKSGVAVVNPQGEKFNPELHQAMSMQENAEFEPNTVLAVVQKGYTLNGRIIRPAMVIVSKAAAKPTDNQIDEMV